MQATAPQIWNGLGPLGTSAIFHLAAIFAIIFLHFTPLKSAAPESTVSVELLPADTFDEKNTAKPSEAPKVDASTESVVREADVAKPLSPEIPATKDQTEEGSPTSSAPKTETKSRAFVRANHFYASEVLKNPKSKGTASDLRKLSPEERMIQLCNLEAMEQVSRWKTRIKADFLVSYAMADTRRSGQKSPPMEPPSEAKATGTISNIPVRSPPAWRRSMRLNSRWAMRYRKPSGTRTACQRAKISMTDRSRVLSVGGCYLQACSFFDLPSLPFRLHIIRVSPC